VINAQFFTRWRDFEEAVAGEAAALEERPAAAARRADAIAGLVRELGRRFSLRGDPPTPHAISISGFSIRTR